MIGILIENKRSARQVAELLKQLVARELRGRYVGSLMGLFWSVIHPIVNLAVYTFVFSYILNVRFVEGGGTRSFALYLFCGLLPFLSFSETVSRCTTSLVDNANMVKNLDFPAKTIQFSIGLAALSTQLIGLAILLVARLLIEGKFAYLAPATIPIMFFLFLLSLGVGFITCTLHVFFRDTFQLVSVGLTLLFYVTPILYPLHLIPSNVRIVFFLNPLTYVANNYRYIILNNGIPDFTGFLLFSIFSLFIFFVGYRIFTSNFGQMVDDL